MSNCTTCNKCKDECGCKRPVTSGPKYAFDMGSFVWTGPQITCGNNVIVDTGQTLDQGFANMAAYVCGIQLIPGPQGNPGQDGAQGPPGADGTPGSNANIILQNTLHVTKNGTAAGLRNYLGNTFDTIEGASAAAQAGDLVIIYPGVYVEIADFIKSDVFYYFHKGAEVSMLFSSGIGDQSGAKNIYIYGKGKFTGLVQSCVALINPASTIIFEFEESYGAQNCFSLINCSFYYIKGFQSSQGSQYLSTIRGDSEGIFDVKFQISNPSLGGAAHFIVNHGLSAIEPKRLIFRGERLVGISSAGLGIICVQATGSFTEVIDEILYTDLPINPVATSEPIYLILGGKFSSRFKTFNCNNGPIVNQSFFEILNCRVRLKSFYVAASGSTNRIINNDVLSISGNDLDTIIRLDADVSADIIGNLINNKSTDTDIIQIAVPTTSSRICIGDNVLCNATGGTTGKAIGAPGPVNIQYIKNNYSNVAADVNITNTITGTSLITDSDITLLEHITTI